MIQPGLERISLLLKNVEFPWKAIHVAGTNGKGSICHIASNLLKRRTIRIGTFTTPHYVDRWDSILINNTPLKEPHFKGAENEIIALNAKESINASPFEILTATALTCFNRAKIDVGIIEVGMGGKLDATNILNNQVISVISKIARDHEEYLGKTLGEIALHKAGILRPNVPYIVNPMNERYVQQVIDDYAKEIGAGPRLFGDTPVLRETLFSKPGWRTYASHQRPFQRDNTVLGIIAAKTAMKEIGIMTDDLIVDELGKLRSQVIPGRFQQMQVSPVFGNEFNDGKRIIVDGGHNVDAALALSELVHKKLRLEYDDTREQPPARGWGVNWVVAMTEGKDAEGYLRTILRPEDRIITTSFGPVDGMPWVKPMDPGELLKIAQRIHPGIIGFAMPSVGALRALCAAKALKQPGNRFAMVGSLYLVGELTRELRDMPKTHHRFWNRSSLNPARDDMRRMHNEEMYRVQVYWRNLNKDTFTSDIDAAPSVQHKLRQVESELQALDQEINDIKQKENLPLTVRFNPQPPRPENGVYRTGEYKYANKRLYLERDYNDNPGPADPQPPQRENGQYTKPSSPGDHGEDSDSGVVRTVQIQKPVRIRYSNANPYADSEMYAHKKAGIQLGKDSRNKSGNVIKPSFLQVKDGGED